MKKEGRIRSRPLILGLAVTAAIACAPKAEPPRAAPEASTPAATPASGVVEVTAADYAFQLPEELPSGWTTFEFANRGKEPHFFLLSLLPEGKSVDDYRTEVGGAFDDAWAALQRGLSKHDALELLGGSIPEWFGSVRQMGGVGLVVPGETARTSLLLVPGTYVMECYVKTADGKFHTALGMLRGLTISDASSGTEEPQGDLAVHVKLDGFEVEGEPTAGPHTVAVHFDEQPEGAPGNDVHLVRLDDATDLDGLVAWMDWMNVEGLRTPAPARFLGGVQEMPAGSTAYFQVDLMPGRYAWIGESSQPRLLEFTVAPPAP